MLHAACVRRDSHVLALAGRSGSGKSTLAQHLAESGWQIVSDDALLATNGRCYPVYRRVKWSTADDRTFMYASGKSFSNLGGLDAVARAGMALTHILFIRLSPRFGMAPLLPDEAAERLFDACAPEVAGGLPSTRRRLQALAYTVPGILTLLGPDPAQNVDGIEKHLTLPGGSR